MAVLLSAVLDGAGGGHGDNDVYTTNERDPGGLGAVWKRVSNFGLASAFVTLVPTVTAAGITGERASPNTFAMAYSKPDDRLIYIRIQKTDGTVIHDWDPL